MITNPSEDYARGWVPFLGQKIFLDSRPLIPRVETEYWTEKAIADINTRLTKSSIILDLFAGSGCIGIAVLAHVPGAMVDFGELEARHFPTIKKSLQENQTSDVRYRLIQTDVWSNLPAQAGITDRHDYIFANPPYLEKTNEKETLLKDEPPEALFAGDGGFALIEKTLRGAREHLNPGGQLWLEHEPGQSARIAALSAELGLTSETHPDQFGVDRYTVAYCRT